MHGIRSASPIPVFIHGIRSVSPIEKSGEGGVARQPVGLGMFWRHPHRGARNPARESAGSAGAPQRGRQALPGERSGPQFHGGARQGAAQVILGIGMTAGKARAAAAEEGVDLAVRRTAAQQFLSDPLVGNAPVGIGEALRNVESAQPSRIDGSRCGGGQGEVAWSENRGDGGESGPVACAELGLGRLHQCGQCGATPDCACSSFTQGA